MWSILKLLCHNPRNSSYFHIRSHVIDGADKHLGGRSLIRAGFPLLTRLHWGGREFMPHSSTPQAELWTPDPLEGGGSVHSSCIYKCMLTACQQSGIVRSLITSRFKKELLGQPFVFMGESRGYPPTINHVNWFTDKMSVKLHSHSAVAPPVTV